MTYDWPGNVRELENFVERALIQSSGDELNMLHMDVLWSPGTPQQGAVMSAYSDSAEIFPTLDAVCSSHIRRALRRTAGKISGPGGAAELLKLHPNTLRQRMDKLGIPYRRRSGARIQSGNPV
jgi:DNA-binding NtrC family response regulator